MKRSTYQPMNEWLFSEMVEYGTELQTTFRSHAETYVKQHTLQNIASMMSYCSFFYKKKIFKSSPCTSSHQHRKQLDNRVSRIHLRSKIRIERLQKAILNIRTYPGNSSRTPQHFVLTKYIAHISPFQEVGKKKKKKLNTRTSSTVFNIHV